MVFFRLQLIDPCRRMVGTTKFDIESSAIIVLQNCFSVIIQNVIQLINVFVSIAGKDFASFTHYDSSKEKIDHLEHRVKYFKLSVVLYYWVSVSSTLSLKKLFLA